MLEALPDDKVHVIHCDTVCSRFLSPSLARIIFVFASQRLAFLFWPPSQVTMVTDFQLDSAAALAIPPAE